MLTAFASDENFVVVGLDFQIPRRPPIQALKAMKAGVVGLVLNLDPGQSVVCERLPGLSINVNLRHSANLLRLNCGGGAVTNQARAECSTKVSSEIPNIGTVRT